MLLPVRFVGIIASAVFVIAVFSSCAPAEGDSASAQPAAGGCTQFQSFTGRFVVGSPTPSPPGLVPFVPGTGAPNVEFDTATMDSVKTTGNSTAGSVVYEFGGDGAVGWSARFVQSPFLAGTGGAVPVSGICVLQVDLTGVKPLAGSVSEPLRAAPEGAPSSVVEVLTYGIDDALSQSFIGFRQDAVGVTVESSESSLTVKVGDSQ